MGELMAKLDLLGCDWCGLGLGVGVQGRGWGCWGWGCWGGVEECVWGYYGVGKGLIVIALGRQVRVGRDGEGIGGGAMV